MSVVGCRPCGGGLHWDRPSIVCTAVGSDSDGGSLPRVINEHAAESWDHELDDSSYASATVSAASSSAAGCGTTYAGCSARSAERTAGSWPNRPATHPRRAAAPASPEPAGTPTTSATTCRQYVAEQLGETDGVLIIDDTGFIKKGTTSAGVQRQYSGTAGRTENCQIGVFAAYASARAGPWWTGSCTCPSPGPTTGTAAAPRRSPTSGTFATKGDLAKAMVLRALASPLPIAWVTADSAYGQEWRFRRLLETAGVGYVLAVPKSQQRARCPRIDCLFAQAPDEAWERLSCGGRRQGPAHLRLGGGPDCPPSTNSTATSPPTSGGRWPAAASASPTRSPTTSPTHPTRHDRRASWCGSPGRAGRSRCVNRNARISVNRRLEGCPSVGAASSGGCTSRAGGRGVRVARPVRPGRRAGSSGGAGRIGVGPGPSPWQPSRSRVIGGMPISAASWSSHHSSGPGASPGGGRGRRRRLGGWPSWSRSWSTVRRLILSRPLAGRKPSAARCSAMALARCPCSASSRIRSRSLG